MVIGSVFRLEVFTLFHKWSLISCTRTFLFSWEDHFSPPCDHEFYCHSLFLITYKIYCPMRSHSVRWNVSVDVLECHMLVPVCWLVRNLDFHSKPEAVRLSWDKIGFKPMWWRLNVIPHEGFYFGTFFLFRITNCASLLLSGSTENNAVVLCCLCPVFFLK